MGEGKISRSSSSKRQTTHTHTLTHPYYYGTCAAFRVTTCFLCALVFGFDLSFLCHFASSNYDCLFPTINMLTCFTPSNGVDKNCTYMQKLNLFLHLDSYYLVEFRWRRVIWVKMLFSKTFSHALLAVHVMALYNLQFVVQSKYFGVYFYCLFCWMLILLN